MKKISYFLVGMTLLTSGCILETTEETNPSAAARTQRTLTLGDAQQLVKLPVKCISVEYPNKLNQVIDSEDDLRSPKDLHPAFYGCFDWHSAVHGHWSLVRLLKSFPQLEEADTIMYGLKNHLTAEKIALETEYFEDSTNTGFERMYGWAWLLKLTTEIRTWDHPEARELEKNLLPLANVIAGKCREFLPKLNYAIRVGTHTNTAFGMAMIYDYAVEAGDKELKKCIVQRARDFYLNDIGCPLEWEPSGYDFLSPCLEEANLMRRILSTEEFRVWMKKFLPELSDKNVKIKPGIVSDREDGHLVHLDGLNFSRAWCLYGLANTAPEEYGHLIGIANQHIKHSLPHLVGDSYEGGHWLASFALLSLTSQ